MKKTVLAAALAAFTAGRSQAASFEDGRRLLSEKRYPEAVAQLELEAHANPGSPDVLLNLGWAYWHDKRIDDASRVGATLVTLDPENRVFLVFLANTDIEKKDYLAAAALANKALSISPGDHDASMVLSRALFLAGRKDEAMALLDKIVELFPDDSAAVYRKAEFQSDLGRKKEALASLDKLLTTDPSNAAYRRGRAKILSDLGRQEEAKDEWKELTRKEVDAQSLMNLGWAYWREKNYEEAWKIATILVKLDDKNPAFLRFMANMEIERMNYAEALRLAQSASSLAPGDLQVALTTAKALFRMQRVKESMAILEKLIAQYPDNAHVEYRWAEFLFRTGRPEESLSFFDRLIKADPTNETYRLTRGMALYELGRFDDAVAEWDNLSSEKDPNVDAVRLMRDDAFNRRDWESAVDWQNKILAYNPADPIGWMKLSKIYSAMKNFPDALSAAERAIQADPIDINGYYIKGELLEQMENWPEAKTAFQEIIARNPNSTRAFDDLSYASEAQGRYRDALKILRHIETLTAPSVSPYLEIHKARVLADSGRFAQAHAVLKRVEADRRTVIPILLYHGLSRYDRTDSIPQEAFREQMRAVKKRGYQTLTVSELDDIFQGKGVLPAKPILITFDDARTDSFENADPVLAELGFRATMFVHVSKLRKTHFHASPEDIQKWQATGRWEMQAHGFQAHDPMPLDGFGRKGHFLANRMWLAEKDRLETVPEYRARVAGEYQKAKSGVEEIVAGHPVVAFAYPYGDFGQDDYTNTPESAGINRLLVREKFHMAFVQEANGINTLSSNPLNLGRFEVPRNMTARQLTAHLALSDPRVQAQILEAQLWIRADQVGQAEAVFADLEAQGLDESRLWAEEGVAYQKGGDLSYAQNLFSRAWAAEPDAEGPGGEQDQKALAQSKHAGAPTVSAEVQKFTDSDTNAISKEILRASAQVKSFTLGGWAGHGDYFDRLNPSANLPHIHSGEGGLQLHWFVDRKLELDGFYARRVFSDGATGFSDNYLAAAAYQLVPSLKLAARDGLGNVETAAAIRSARKFHSDGGGAAWDPALNWKAGVDYDQSRFNDHNLEQDLRLRLTKRFSERIAVGAAYFNGDSKFRAPDYYTPRGLNQYTGLITLNQTVGKVNPRTGLTPAEAQLQYEGGYGFQPEGGSMVNSVKAVLTYRPWDFLSLTVDGQYAQSPQYISRLAHAAVVFSF